MSNNLIEEKKENDEDEQIKKQIQKRLQENIIFLFNQLTKGCFRNHCYNNLCFKNKLTQLSKILNIYIFRI
jgi:hypothetical protein